MTQKEKSLLLKVLCEMLPYDVRCEVCDPQQDYEENIFVLHLIHIDAWTSRCYFWGWSETDPFKIEQVKPYLRTPSSMTEEEMDKLFEILHIDKDGNDEDWIKINDATGITFFFPSGKDLELVDNALSYLRSIHIDVNGLIPKHLAIEVTKENNPYKEIKL